MRIEQLELLGVPVNHRGGWMFVRLHAKGGLTGLGEASHSGDDSMLVGMLQQRAAPVLVGSELDDIDELRQRLALVLEPATRHLLGQTLYSALEQALWDLLGQRLGAPIWAILGGSGNGRIPLYANINRASPDRSSEGMARVAKLAAAAGFRAIKCSPFDELMPDEEDGSRALSAIEAGIHRVAAIRDAIGPEVELMVDCHGRCGRWTPELAPRLFDLGVGWLEEPVPSHDGRKLREIAEVVPQRLALGERLYGMSAYTQFLGWERSPILMPDVKHAGGISECLAIADMAESHGNSISLHNPSGPVSTAASLHVMACRPESLPLEFAWGEVSWRASLVDPAERVYEDGTLELPWVPGLGVRLRDPEYGPKLQVLWSSERARTTGTSAWVG